MNRSYGFTKFQGQWPRAPSSGWYSKSGSFPGRDQVLTNQSRKMFWKVGMLWLLWNVLQYVAIADRLEGIVRICPTSSKERSNLEASKARRFRYPTTKRNLGIWQRPLKDLENHLWHLISPDTTARNCILRCYNQVILCLLIVPPTMKSCNLVRCLTVSVLTTKCWAPGWSVPGCGEMPFGFQSATCRCFAEAPNLTAPGHLEIWGSFRCEMSNEQKVSPDRTSEPL